MIVNEGVGDRLGDLVIVRLGRAAGTQVGVWLCRRKVEDNERCHGLTSPFVERDQRVHDAVVAYGPFPLRPA